MNTSKGTQSIIDKRRKQQEKENNLKRTVPSENHPMPATTLPYTQELIDYYRQRIERAEQDYQDAFDALDKIKISHEDFHAVSWELYQRTNEIETLQKALSEAQSYLYEERKQFLKCLAENDELRIQELKDRKKIRYLLAMYGLPDQEETTYFKEELEKRFVKRMSNNIKSSTDSLQDFSDDVDNEDPESLRLRCLALKAQLEEQKKMFEDNISALKQEKDIIAEEAAARQRHDKLKIEQLLKRLEKLQNYSRENTRELLETKRAHNVVDRRNKEEKARVFAEWNNLRLKYGEEKGKNTSLEKVSTDYVDRQSILTDLKAIENKISRRNDIILSEMRQNIAKYETALEQERMRHTDVQADYERKLEMLQKRLNVVEGEKEALQERRQNDIDGFVNEISALKQEVKRQESALLKTFPLEDREHEYLRIAKENGDRAAELSGKLHDMKGRIYETERELYTIPF